MSIQLGAVLADQFRRLRYEPTAKRVRTILGGVVAADSQHAVLVWEPDRPIPSYAIPRESITVTVRDRAASNHLPDAPTGHNIPGRAVTVGTGAGQEASGFIPDDPGLAGLVILDFPSFDSWLEEDEEIQGHPRDPFHRVDLRRTSRRIQVLFHDEVLADTTHGKLLFETSLPTRYYIPRHDVLPELLPSPTRTRCPYKGEASYWSFVVHGNVMKDLVWSYETPLADAPELRGYVAFYDEEFDVLLEDLTDTHRP